MYRKFPTLKKGFRLEMIIGRHLVMPASSNDSIVEGNGSRLYNIFPLDGAMLWSSAGANTVEPAIPVHSSGKNRRNSCRRQFQYRWLHHFSFSPVRLPVLPPKKKKSKKKKKKKKKKNFDYFHHLSQLNLIWLHRKKKQQLTVDSRNLFPSSFFFPTK